MVQSLEQLIPLPHLLTFKQKIGIGKTIILTASPWALNLVGEVLRRLSQILVRF